MDKLSHTQLAALAGIRDTQYWVTRPIGERFAAALTHLLDSYSTIATVILDFKGSALIDGSFADEVFGNLALKRRNGTRSDGLPRIVLSGLNSASIENVTYALESRVRMESRIRNIVYPALVDDTLTLIGAAEDNVRETFAALCQTASMTARDVQEAFPKDKLSINAASTRLKTLFDLGLARRSDRRDAPGGQYTYYPPI